MKIVKMSLGLSIALIMGLNAESSSSMGSFLFKRSEFKRPKLFINDTGKTLVITWQIKCLDTDTVYMQSPLIVSGGSHQFDVEQGLKYLEKKSGQKCDHYTLDVGIGVVTKAPIRPRTQFDYRALNGSESGITLTKKEFLKYRVFRLYKDENGKIFYKGDAEL